MSKLDEILPIDAIQKGIKEEIKELFKGMAEAWRDEEYIAIDEFIAEIEQL